jgi:hypothetical protein
MAVGLAAATLNSWLDALCRSVTYTEPPEFWVKIHLGDPGASGANNAAVETTRKQATFSAASSGAITTSGALTWTNVSTTETYSHVSYWDASTAGTFLGSAALASSKAVTAGDTFTIATGDVDLSITPVAA